MKVTLKKLTTLALRETQCFTKLLVVNITNESAQHMLKNHAQWFKTLPSQAIE